MGRYLQIISAQFAQAPLPLPVSARVVRRVEVHPAAGCDSYVTSVQTSAGAVEIHLRIRDTAAAENLTPGQDGELKLTVAATDAGRAAREITVSAAVLTAVELSYRQTDPAEATLRFLAQADDGGQSPFAAEDEQ